MHKIDGAGNVAGAFTEGTPGVQEATVLTADWCNAVQTELVNAIEDMGGVLSKPDNTQLETGLRATYGAKGTTNTWELAQTFQGNVTIQSTGALDVDGNSTLGTNAANTQTFNGVSTFNAAATFSENTSFAAGKTVTVGGDLTVDTDVLKVDTTNNRVGVGTAAPNALLSVGHAGVVDANVPVQINAAASGEAYFSANKGGSLGLLLGYSNGGGPGTKALIRNVQNEPISVRINNSTEVAEFNASGIAVKTANPTSSDSFTNTLTPLNICKAWGVIACGGGTASLAEGFNITDAIHNGNNVDVTVAGDFAGTTFAVVITQQTKHTYFYYTDSFGVGGFTIKAVDTAGADVDLKNVASLRIHFVCFGAQ